MMKKKRKKKKKKKKTSLLPGKVTHYGIDNIGGWDVVDCIHSHLLLHLVQHIDLVVQLDRHHTRFLSRRRPPQTW